MIELVIAALIQLGTLTTDVTSTTDTFDGAPQTTTTTTVDSNPGGAGTWDDGN